MNIVDSLIIQNSLPYNLVSIRFQFWIHSIICIITYTKSVGFESCARLLVVWCWWAHSRVMVDRYIWLVGLPHSRDHGRISLQKVPQSILRTINGVSLYSHSDHREFFRILLKIPSRRNYKFCYKTMNINTRN